MHPPRRCGLAPVLAAPMSAPGFAPHPCERPALRDGAAYLASGLPIGRPSAAWLEASERRQGCGAAARETSGWAVELAGGFPKTSPGATSATFGRSPGTFLGRAVPRGGPRP